MKVMSDTSVLVPALVKSHPHHPKSAELLNRSLNREFEWFVAAHSLAECYATLTAKTKTLNLQPLAVAKSIQDHFVTPASGIVELTVDDYLKCIQKVASLGLSSGVIYDAILAIAAQKIGVDHLYTFNVKHFPQVWPEGDKIVATP